MKNHTTTAMLLTLGATMAFVSCTNIADIDILDIGSEQRTWKQELSDIISDNAQVLQNSGLTLKSYRKLGSATFDASEFFEESTGQYPVYTGSLDKFTLMPYSFVAEDTVTMHFKMDHLKKHVAETLADRHYTAVLLTWEKDGQTLQTTALFNTETGELEYDNILFNLITEMSIDSVDASLLSRGENTTEPNSFDNGSDYVYFTNQFSDILASSWIIWTEFGEYIPVTYYEQDSILKTGVDYHHIRTSYQAGGTKYNSSVTYGHSFEDLGASDHAFFRYIIWAGPSGTVLDLNDYSVGLNQCFYINEYIESWHCDRVGLARCVLIDPSNGNKHI